ncbi:MAG: hypothetical protein HYU66_05425 [Armatimonadetes bacterium]|nr:hypothetical protein [Armatimonadota bacterium]
MAKAQQELERARREQSELLEEALRAAKGKIIYDRNSELGRRRIEVTSDEIEANVRDRLEAFLRELDRTARENGAGEDPGGRSAVPLQIDESGRPVPEDVFLPGVARGIKQRGEPVWVRAVVLLNTVEGRPVYYAFEYYVDRVVYAEGALIDSTVVDGGQDEPAIVRSIEALMRDKVTTKALERGMLPSLERRVGPEVWFPVLRQVKALGREVTVEARAARDIRIGDPLAVSFKVRDDVGP